MPLGREGEQEIIKREKRKDPTKPPLKGEAFLKEFPPYTGNCLLEAEQLGSVSDGGRLERVFI